MSSINLFNGDGFDLQSEEIKFFRSNSAESMAYLKKALGENPEKKTQEIFHQVIVDPLTLQDHFLATHIPKRRDYVKIFFCDCNRQTWGLENGMLCKEDNIPEFLKELFTQYFKFLEDNCSLIPAILENYERLEKLTHFNSSISEENFIKLLIEQSNCSWKLNLENFFEVEIDDFKINFIQQVVLQSRMEKLIPKLIQNNPELAGKEEALAAMPRIALLNVMMVTNQCLPKFPHVDVYENSRMDCGSDYSYVVKPDLNGIRIEQKVSAIRQDGPTFSNIFEINALVPYRDKIKAVRYEYCKDLTFGKDTTDQQIKSITKTYLSINFFDIIKS